MGSFFHLLQFHLAATVEIHPGFVCPNQNGFLFCFVLFCFVLFCFVLFCFVLFCFVLFCFVLFCFVSQPKVSMTFKCNPLCHSKSSFVLECFVFYFHGCSTISEYLS